jgi:energy-coupling factor transporter ATP-binding protein EcfA2
VSEAVRLTALSFRYADGERWALHDVNLTVHPGETLLVLGPSGSGKSTLALCLNGLIPHMIDGEMQGEVHIDGQSTLTLHHAQLCQKVGMVFQDPEAQMVMPRVDEEIAFGLENLAIAPSEMPERITAALSAVGLLEQRQAWVSTLSGGQKQRLALAAILALHPSLFVFDEPTANLDPAATQAFFETVQRLRAGLNVTTILIEHDLDAALPLVDRVAALNETGTVIAEGTPQQVFANQRDELTRQGIWLPAVCRLAQALNDAGQPLAAFPLSVPEAETALRPLVTTVLDQELPPLPAPPISHGETAIDLDEVDFAYPGGLSILQRVDFHVRRGSFCALAGANGSGKTTLARHMVGLLRPRRGRVRILGRDVRHLNAQELARQVGYVFQNPEHQFVSERVADELAYSLRKRWGEAEARRRVEWLLHTFDLERYANANPFALSQGQKRRLSVATMVALEQPILVLDEPTFGQDQRNLSSLMTLLKALHATGVTILLITHNMELIAEYAEEVAVMHEGQIIYHGPTRALFNRPALLQQANLNLPPLAELGQRLGLPTLITVTDWVKWLTDSRKSERPSYASQPRAPA